MKRHPLGVTTLVAATAAALAFGLPARPAGAADVATGGDVLDMLCRDKSGQPYFTPYTISRCQEARDKAGFDVERLICEGLLGGRFSVADSPTRKNRSNWACVSGAPSP